MKNKFKVFFVLFMVLALIIQPAAITKAATAPATKVTKKTLYVGGDNYKITFNNLAESATVTYSSSDKKVATVTTQGVVKPVAKGTAVITVKITQSKKNYESKITVTVMNPYVKITNPVKELKVGDTYKFEAKTYGLKKTSTTWSVSDKSVAKIDVKTRTLTALKAGTVKVTFKDTVSNKSNTITITITSAKANPTATPTPTPKPTQAPVEVPDLPEDELFGYDVTDDGAIITEIYDISLTSVDIPRKLGGYTVTAIDDGVFEAMSDLKTVKMPSTITYIGDNAFASCESLTSITIPSSVTHIGDSAFEYCSSLTKLTLPEKLTEMGSNMFEGCGKLASITIPAGISELPEYSFSECVSLKTVTFKEGLQLIGDEAFYGCTALASVEFPKSLKEIYGSAFEGCTSLAKITFSSGLESIEDSAFEGCVKLTSVVLPGTLTYLGSAFAGCEKLSSVTIPKSVEDIGSGAFDDCSASLKIKVKKNSYAYEYVVDEEIPYSTY
ncbi:MAG: leucine-rich repeat protein [Lachnospiraceae bacterium]|nr:leucine-rich repeat protein [Lachnospiraceae bacterium]